MRLAVSLDLRHLVQWLEPGAHLGILAVDRAAIQPLRGKHLAVGYVAVVRDRQHAAARLLLIICHVVPQLFGINRVERRERQYLLCLIGAVLENDDPV